MVEPIYDLFQAKQAHRGHWFSAGAMRYFNCRVGTRFYPDHPAQLSYFVSSEKHQDDPRAYTVRSIHWVSGDVATVGHFQGYSSNAAAGRAIANILKGD